MTIDIVLDHPRRRRVRRLLSRLAGTIAGSALLLVGLLAALCLLPAAGLVLGVLGGVNGLPASDPAIVAAAVALIGVTFAGHVLGLRMLRGNRELVLLLRRFGHRDATKVATYAATKTIGRSWRLVTLDDAAVTPVGVASGLTGLVAAVAAAKRIGPKIVNVFKWLSFGAFWVAAAIVGLKYWQDGTLEPYDDVLETLLEGRIPEDAFQASLVGVVAACGIVLAACALAAGVGALLVVVGLLLTPLLSAGAMALDAAGAAEESKLRKIDSAPAIHTVAADLERGSRKILAPRLVVLRVDSAVWQPTVLRMAQVGSMTIIDVSEPTESLLWEVQELSDRLGPRCVFVGHHDRLTELAAGAAALGPVHERLMFFLDGREVLAYHTDRRSIRRFAHALQAKLLDVSARYGEVPAVPAPATAGSPVARDGVEPADARRLEEEIAACDGIVERYGQAPEPAQRERVAAALSAKRDALDCLARVDEAIGACDEIVRRFGDAPEAALRERVAQALEYKAAALELQEEFDEQLAVLDDVLARYAGAPEAGLRARIPTALVDKAVALGKLGRDEEAVALCDDVIERFGAAPGLAVQADVARAHVAKTATLAARGSLEDAIAVCDSVIAKYSDATEPALLARVAGAKVNKGAVLDKLGRPQEASALYDEVIRRHRSAREPALQQVVAMALHRRYWTNGSRSFVGKVLALRSTLRARAGKP